MSIKMPQVTLLNSSANLLSDATNDLCARVNKHRTTSLESTYDYLFDEDVDVGELIASVKKEAMSCYPHFSYEPDELLDLVAGQAGKFMIGLSRIKVGKESGFIDLIGDAIIQTQRGWENSSGNVVLQANSSIDDIAAYASKFGTIVENYFHSDLLDAEKTGVLTCLGRVIAEKQPSGKWKDLDSERLFDEGTLVRLLHHSDRVVTLTMHSPEDEYFHAHVSKHSSPEANVRIRKGTCRQGDALYSGSSLDELVSVYGNPKSFEISGKILSEFEKQGIAKDGYDHGHLYRTKNIDGIATASFAPAFITMGDIPSLPAVMLMAKHCNVNLVYASNAWLSIKSAKSTYDVYRVIDDFSALAARESGQNNAMKMLYSGMGFKGLEILFPSADLLAKMEDRVRLINSVGGVNVDSITSSVSDYILKTRNSIPPKAQGGHLLLFTPLNEHLEHLVSYPTSRVVLGAKQVVGEIKTKLNTGLNVSLFAEPSNAATELALMNSVEWKNNSGEAISFDGDEFTLGELFLVTGNDFQQYAVNELLESRDFLFHNLWTGDKSIGSVSNFTSSLKRDQVKDVSVELGQEAIMDTRVEVPALKRMR
jgi:hypothetical protein